MLRNQSIRYNFPTLMHFDTQESRAQFGFLGRRLIKSPSLWSEPGVGTLPPVDFTPLASLSGRPLSAFPTSSEHFTLLRPLSRHFHRRRPPGTFFVPPLHPFHLRRPRPTSSLLWPKTDASHASSTFSKR